MSKTVAFLDASVLYPSQLRNLLMHLALTGLFQAKWSARVQDEWIDALLRRRPDLSRDKLERTRMLMNKHADGAVVEGYEHWIEKLVLPDPDDRHVVAAAIACGAHLIITANLRHFPRQALTPHRIRAMHPDPFVTGLLRAGPELVLTAARDHMESLKNPRLSIPQYCQTLHRHGLEQTAAALRLLL